MSFHIRKDFCAHVFENYFNVRRFYMSETLLNGIKSREKKNNNNSAMLRKEMVHICVTQCTKGDFDVTFTKKLIKLYYDAY